MDFNNNVKMDNNVKMEVTESEQIWKEDSGAEKTADKKDNNVKMNNNVKMEVTESEQTWKEDSGADKTAVKKEKFPWDTRQKRNMHISQHWD